MLLQPMQDEVRTHYGGEEDNVEARNTSLSVSIQQLAAQSL